MKLSEMRTEEFADALCDIAPAVANIAEDDKLNDAISATADAYRHGGNIKIIATIAKTLLPALLKDHRQDLYAILAGTNGKTLTDVANQSAAATIHQIRELISTDFANFFTQPEHTGED